MTKRYYCLESRRHRGLYRAVVLERHSGDELFRTGLKPDEETARFQLLWYVNGRSEVYRTFSTRGAAESYGRHHLVMWEVVELDAEGVPVK